MNNLTYLMPLLVLVGFAVYYFFFYRKVKKAGGWAGYAAQYQAERQARYREQLGLSPEESIVAHFGGQLYIGKLIPGSAPSAGKQLLGALTSTTYRGVALLMALTDKQRLAIAVEPQDADSSHRQSGLIGYEAYFEPMTILDGPAQVLSAAEAFAGSPHLPKPSEAPQLVSAGGNHEQVRYELVQIRTQDGAAPLTVWVEPDGVHILRQWAGNTGPA